MPVSLEWRRSTLATHFGSSEIKGGGAPPGGIIIYRHPTEPDGSIASPSANWTYNHADATNTPVIATSFDLVCSGFVAFDRYATDRAAYAAMGGGAATFRGQERANRVYAPAQAGYIQTSGEAVYEPWLVGPAGTRIGVSFMLYVYAMGMAAPHARVGGSMKVAAQIGICVGTGMVRARTSAKLLFPADSKQDGAGGIYEARIPKAGELKLGSVSVGPGFNLSAGSATFLAVARGSFSFFEGVRGLPKMGC